MSKEEWIKFRKSKCELCGTKDNVGGRALNVHHIDKNKDNNTTDNLMTLCNGCHYFAHVTMYRVKSQFGIRLRSIDNKIKGLEMAIKEYNSLLH